MSSRLFFKVDVLRGRTLVWKVGLGAANSNSGSGAFTSKFKFTSLLQHFTLELVPSHGGYSCPPCRFSGLVTLLCCNDSFEQMVPLSSFTSARFMELDLQHVCHSHVLIFIKACPKQQLRGQALTPPWGFQMQTPTVGDTSVIKNTRVRTK